MFKVITSNCLATLLTFFSFLISCHPLALAEPTSVNIAFHLDSLNNIDDEAETFDFTGVLTLSWRDPRSAFTPAQGEPQIKVVQGDSGGFSYADWYPVIILGNESGRFEKQGTLLTVQPDGTTSLVEKISATAKGNFNMRHYPFDRQNLKIVFKSLSLLSREAVFETQGESISLAPDIRVDQWSLLEGTVEVKPEAVNYPGFKQTIPTFVVSLQMQRQPLFMLRLVVLPLIMMVVLSWSVFWMERSSLGDRINVSFVGILTAVAYQIVVSDILPHISYITLMNGFLNISMLVMCATVVENLVVGACDKRGKVKLGDSIDYRCRIIFPLAYIVIVLLFAAVIYSF